MRESRRGAGCAVGLVIGILLLAGGIFAALKLYERYGPSYVMADIAVVSHISGILVSFFIIVEFE